jgi:hypothetical protein
MTELTNPVTRGVISSPDTQAAIWFLGALSQVRLSGELRVFAGEEEHTAGPGTVAVLPRRIRHAYVVISATARFLTLHTPAGFEQFAAEVGEPAQALALPPEPPGPPDFAALAAVAARHHITILAPPPRP